MDEKIIDFITKERVCVVSVILPDGSPHSATVHFSHTQNPLRFFIQTTNDTVKVQPLLDGKISKASMVIGFSEKDWMTVQMRGEARIVIDQKELEEVYAVHYKKHPSSEKYKNEDTVFIEFTPTWWRYTDFNTHPETIVEG